MRFCLSGCLWSTKISISFIFSPKIMPWLPPGVHISRVHSCAFPHSFPYNKACNAGDLGSIHGLGRSPGEGNGNPLQFSCLGSPMDRGDCQVTGHGVTRIGHHWATEPPPPSFNPARDKRTKENIHQQTIKKKIRTQNLWIHGSAYSRGCFASFIKSKAGTVMGDACVWSQCHLHPSKNTCGDRESYLSECNLLLGAPRASTPCLLRLFLFLLFWAPKLSLLWRLVTFDSHIHVTFRLLLP